MQIALIGVLTWVALTSGNAPLEQTADCRFSISHAAEPAAIIGVADATVPAFIMRQPDSPLAIMAADLSGVSMTAAPGAFTRSGRHVVDVKNVSTSVITQARILVKTGVSSGSGVGSGAKLSRPLQPGEQTRIEWRSGNGRGSDRAGREVFVMVLIEEVQTPGCTFKPSQSWPTRNIAESVDR